MRRWVVTVIGLCLVAPGVAGQVAQPGDAAYLKTLSLEELAALEVYSVSRRTERASDAAAAIHIITEEDIRRSGANSLPEVLRLASNLQVARASSRSWAISARGFSAPFSNKLLVLVDGRTVYSPLFSGVFWDAQDTLLEDIDRIEVISGPGATMWGANAVNGVINVITKSARDTRGMLASVGGGTEENFFGGVRYGSPPADALGYRVYAKYFNRSDSLTPVGDPGGDGWRAGRAGMRVDWSTDERTEVTLQGDLYSTRADQLEQEQLLLSGGHLLARWTRARTDTERMTVQGYYDRTQQFAPGEFGEDLDTIDLDGQYERQVGPRHHLMLGAGYRYTHDAIENIPGSIAFLPAVLGRHLFSGFVRDEVSGYANRLQLSIGSKFEHNSYTGLEIQPSARLAWSSGRHVFWGAISRAVRTPSRFDRDLYFPAEPPFTFGGGPGFRSEELVASEAGWRLTPHPKAFISLATFFNRYDDLRSTSLGPPFVTENNLEGEIAGAELEATWQVSSLWRLTGGYTVLREDLRVKPGASDLNDGQGEAFDPEQQFQVRSSLTLPRRVELDLWMRQTGQVGATGRGFSVVPAYLTLDARLGWSPVPHLELSITAQHLLDEAHAEFGGRLIQRGVYAKSTWRF
jgi:iron complex outermembrane recepter protein